MEKLSAVWICCLPRDATVVLWRIAPLRHLARTTRDIEGFRLLPGSPLHISKSSESSFLNEVALFGVKRSALVSSFSCLRPFQAHLVLPFSIPTAAASY